MPPFSDATVHTHPRVVGVLVENARHVLERRGVVGDAELPVAVHLRSNGLDRLAEDRRGGIEHRHEDRDERAVLEGAFEIAHASKVRLVQRVVGADPIRVGLSVRIMSALERFDDPASSPRPFA